MKQVGRVLEVWRYPVSSIGGERIDEIDARSDGVAGDRQFALFDRETGLAAAPEKEPRWRPALFLQCLMSPSGYPRIGFPDGPWLALDDKSLTGHLTGYFGFPVAIGMYKQPTVGPVVDLPVVENRYSPSALHILTTGSLRTLAQIGDLPETDRRRFRPSLVIDSNEDIAFPENGWIGKTLRIGAVTATVSEATKRCGMTLAAQPGLLENPDILRNILRHNRRNLGVYCGIVHAGSIATGDAVYADI